MAKDKVVTNITLGHDDDEDIFEVDLGEDDEDLELPENTENEEFDNEEDEVGEDDEEEVAPAPDPRLQDLFNKNQELAEQLNAQKQRYKDLHSKSTKFHKDSVEAQKKQWDSTIETLKNNLVELRKRGDPDNAEQEVDISQKLQDAMLKRTVLDYQEIEELNDDDETDTKNTKQPTQQPVQVPEATQAWLAANPWIKERSEESETAEELADNMIRRGWDPRSKDFYDELDKRLAKRNIGNKAVQKEHSKPKVAGPSQNPRPKNRNKVRLTPEQRRAADNMGIDYKRYAKRLRDMELNRDGKYTNIF